MLVGDLMNQARQQIAADRGDGTYDYKSSFTLVKDIFREADYVIGNLESSLYDQGPYMRDQKESEGTPHCNGPSTYLKAVKYAGFHTLVTANNHMLDCGEKGLLGTIKKVEQYGFLHTGTFKSKTEKRYVLKTVNGINIAVLAYTEYFNRKEYKLSKKKQEYMLNRYSKERVARDIKAAKKAGAEFIIVYNHWGKEYTNQYTDLQKKHAVEIANAGANLIIGSHPHALQTSKYVTTKSGRKVRVMYSMGNFVSHQYKDVTKDTIILRVKLKKENDKVVIKKVGYIPCHVLPEYNGNPYVVTPISSEFNGGIAKDSPYYDELQRSYKRILKVMNGSIAEIKSRNSLR